MQKLTLGPRFRALTLLAKGGMGAVYLAQRVGQAGSMSEGELVAIKVMHSHIAEDPETVGLFIDEARIGTRIIHPNVIRVLDTDVADDLPFIVMEYVEGLSLSSLLRAIGPGAKLPADVAARLVHDVCLGLHAAHASGAVHRDVSPHNFIVGADGRTRITDFGVATFTGRLSATAPGNVRGKLGYMSPEQVARTGVDGRSDVFSAGIVLWELLTGRDLFACESQAETLARVIREPIPAPSGYADVPEALEDTCLKALERSLDRRYESAEAFAKALTAAVPLAPEANIAELVARHGAEALERQKKARAAMAFAPDRLVGDVAEAESALSDTAQVLPPARGKGGPLRAIALGASAIVLVVLGTVFGRLSSDPVRSAPATAAQIPTSTTIASTLELDPSPASATPAVPASDTPATTSSPPVVRPGGRRGAPKIHAPSSARPSTASPSPPPAAPRKADGPYVPGEL